MAMLKPFFEYCVSNKWMESNPARAVKNPKGREMTNSEQKYPFTDEEIQRGTARTRPTSSHYPFIPALEFPMLPCSISKGCNPPAKFAFERLRLAPTFILYMGSSIFHP